MGVCFDWPRVGIGTITITIRIGIRIIIIGILGSMGRNILLILLRWRFGWIRYIAIAVVVITIIIVVVIALITGRIV